MRRWSRFAALLVLALSAVTLWAAGEDRNCVVKPGCVMQANGSGPHPPIACEVGMIWVDTDETDDTNCTTQADNSLCLCVAKDTWTGLNNTATTTTSTSTSTTTST